MPLFIEYDGGSYVAANAQTEGVTLSYITMYARGYTILSNGNGKATVRVNLEKGWEPYRSATVEFTRTADGWRISGGSAIEAMLP